VRHDCTTEIAAAVRKATAPLREEIEWLQDRMFAAARGWAESDATIMELRAEIERLKALYSAQITHEIGLRSRSVQQAVAERDATIMELRDHLSQVNASLAEMTRCRTAADLQHARERQDAAYQRTDDDGPMWRPEEVGT
jgi:chromosome segregation ATPase